VKALDAETVFRTSVSADDPERWARAPSKEIPPTLVADADTGIE
jgi:hypothetical protein